MLNEHLTKAKPELTGSALGGTNRAKRLSPERRREIALSGALAKHNPPAKKLHQQSKPGLLTIGDLKIPCYVLEDETRILSQRGLNETFDIIHGSSNQDGGQKMPRFLGLKALEPFITKDLMAGIKHPIEFIPPHGGRSSFGIPANYLPDICNVWLRAREAHTLITDKHIVTAQKAEIIVRGLSHVGIIALIDEATGYQGVRPKDALQIYLEKIISKELARWAKKFPDEFYENIYKLKGWVWTGMKKNRYSIVGTYTKDLIYDRIAPELTEELKKKSPKDENGQRKGKLHMMLSGKFNDERALIPDDEIGNPLLAQHLHTIKTLQKLALAEGYGWERYIKMVDKCLPKRKAEEFKP